jgi:hypothetical protein
MFSFSSSKIAPLLPSISQTSHGLYLPNRICLFHRSYKILGCSISADVFFCFFHDKVTRRTAMKLLANGAIFLLVTGMVCNRRVCFNEQKVNTPHLHLNKVNKLSQKKHKGRTNCQVHVCDTHWAALPHDKENK